MKLFRSKHKPKSVPRWKAVEVDGQWYVAGLHAADGPFLKSAAESRARQLNEKDRAVEIANAEPSDVVV